MKKLKLILFNLLLFLFSGVKSISWWISIFRVSKTQEVKLLTLLRKNEDTKFGKAHCFSKIFSISEFQSKIPINSYEDFLPYINEVAEGEKLVLTESPVYRFGVSSGSTSSSKLIPYTKDLSSEFESGISPWFWNIFCQNPSIIFGKTYWSVSPVGQFEKYSKGGLPIGFDDEQMYFSKLESNILSTIQVVPKELSEVKDIDAFRYATIRFLMGEKNLTWISVWNPTFFPLLFTNLRDYSSMLIKDINEGSLALDLGLGEEKEKVVRSTLFKDAERSDEIASLFERWENKDYSDLDNNGFTFFESAWPNLKMISCWADGEAKHSLPELKSLFPKTKIEPKGLLATEAFVSFPYKGEASALSVNSHFFEFRLIDDSSEEHIYLAHELKEGNIYEVIVTTGGGLYRYSLNDLIIVLGYKRSCPLIKFVSRRNKVVDVMGEKLNEIFVIDAVTSVLLASSISTNFWLVAPVQIEKEISYVIMIQNLDSSISDEDLMSISKSVEDRFLSNYHYNYCRNIGQLGKLRVFSFSDTNPNEIYITTCLELGQRMGDIKNTRLHHFRHWPFKFNGRYVLKG